MQTARSPNTATRVYLNYKNQYSQVIMDAYGDVLVFNPDTEFKVIDEFEFDELIQRPEEVRFFTLNEQTTDFMEKLLPKTGKVSKAVLQKTEYEVSAFTKLYSKILKETATGFTEFVPDRPTSLPWISYANTADRQVTTYVWEDKWLPLYDDTRGLQANYYIQMLDSLPKSAIFYADGQQTIYPATVNGVRTLGPYEYTKTAYREDGTFRIQPVKRQDTQDVSTFTGYTLDVPPLQPPTPLEGHPFLGAREKPITIETTEDLPTILPSIEAIFQHAVPRTVNPYKEAVPFMKIYDIKLSQVPWTVWRESFPPAELVEEGAPPVEIPLKVDEGMAPAKVLTDVYKSKWLPGLSSRKWLSNQLDGGNLVAKILVSQAGNLGPIAIPPPANLPPPVPIDSSAEECLPTVITEFGDFSDRGLFRTPRCAVCGWYGHGASTCADRRGPVKDEYKPGSGGCMPLALIAAERAETIYAGKKPWVPGTDSTILQEYQALISKYTENIVEIFAKAPEADKPAPPPEARQLIVAILEDEKRTSEDKAADITVIVHDSEAELSNKVYVDKETKQFLVCQHTVSQLSGDMEKDPEKFLKEWSVAESGFKTCKYCGERITDIIQFQEEFDENGRVIQMRSKLSKPSYVPEEHLTFAASLKNLQKLFNVSEPSEDIFYLLLSLMQVLPEEEQLKPVLDFVRSETAKVKAKIAGKSLNAKQKSDIDVMLSVFGFNGIVILMQTHRPQLLPRRSFGSKPLVLRGFPRDSEDTADAPLIDSLLNVLATTFESYPTTFRGSSAILLRNILNDRKSVRKIVMSSMSKQFVPVFANSLRKAKDALAAVDVSYVLHNTFQPPIFKHKDDVFFLAPDATLADASQPRFFCKDPPPPWLVPSMPFSFKQRDINITIPLKPSSKAESIPPPLRPRDTYVPEKDTIRALLRKKVVDFKPLKTVLENDDAEFLRSVLLEWMNVVARSSTAAAAIKEYIRTTRPSVESAYEDKSTLRDYFKGILAEFVGMAVEDETIRADIDKSMSENIVLRSLFAKASDAKKNVDYLRSKERELFKERMRRLPDAMRELKKELIDRGLAPYIITRDDREIFVEELEAEREIPEVEVEVPENEFDVADEDVNRDRDVGPQGEVPEANGRELETDYGDYGDLRARQADAEEGDYGEAFADEEF